MMILSALFLLALFAIVWWLSVKSNNYSWVDVAWAMSFAPVALGYTLGGDGWLPRRLGVGLLVAAWSLRLGPHLWRRVASHHPDEDPRYAVLRERWKQGLQRKFFYFFQAQGVLVWLLTLPVALIVQRTSTSFHLLEWVGLTLWFIALLGEGIADAQLAHFKRSSSHRDAVCQNGLWRYSRHPNYFFQSLLWWGLFLMALPSPWGWLSILAPLSMLHFLLNVTGIPLTEKLSVQKRGDVYREYQRTTSAFIPWFRRA